MAAPRVVHLKAASCVFRSLAIAAPMSFARSRSLRLCLSLARDAYKEVCRVEKTIELSACLEHGNEDTQ